MTRWLAILLLAPSLAVQAGEAPGRHLAVISGIGGEEFYDELFERWAGTLVDAAASDFAIDPANVHRLGGEAGPADREAIGELMGRIAAASVPGDEVMVVLIGHGTARGGRVLFNIPGPDISAAELGELLDAMPKRRIAVVNTASSSGPFIEVLSGPERVIVTATSSASENLAPRFGGHFVTSFTDEADRDKDGRISLREAFVHATTMVEQDFERERRIRTEHALLDDDGDGTGSGVLDEEAGDGDLAARWYLTPGEYLDGSDEARLLTAESQRLVDQIGLLKRRRLQMSEEEYASGLEDLLVDLALNRRALRERVVQ